MINLELVKDELLKTVRARFPDYTIRLTTYPDADDVISIEAYDVPDEECRTVRDLIWDEIEKICTDEYAFVPAVFSRSKTRLYYPVQSCLVKT